MIKIVKTDSDNPDFIKLVQSLDAELAERDGLEHSFYSQFNNLIQIKHVVVIYENDRSLGCGALKEFASDTMEVKRMYVLPESRGKGIATKVLSELEHWTRELGYKKCILETGKRLPEAVALYKKNGYDLIPNYGQYAGVENSVCFEKKLP